MIVSSSLSMGLPRFFLMLSSSAISSKSLSFLLDGNGADSSYL